MYLWGPRNSFLLMLKSSGTLYPVPCATIPEIYFLRHESLSFTTYNFYSDLYGSIQNTKPIIRIRIGEKGSDHFGYGSATGNEEYLRLLNTKSPPLHLRHEVSLGHVFNQLLPTETAHTHWGSKICEKQIISMSTVTRYGTRYGIVPVQ